MTPLDSPSSSDHNHNHNHNNDHDNDAARMRLWDMIKDIRFAMFTSRHANGHLHARPMTTQNSKVDEDASLWFFMSRRGEPVADLALEPVVNVAYADPDANSYVSISGTASVVDDAGKKQQLWTKAAAAWLGYDVQTGSYVAQPDFTDLPRAIADLTADPRKYGFHGTIKAPFRLADGVSPADIAAAVRAVAAQCAAVEMAGLQMINLQGFLAFVPIGDATALTDMAAHIVRSLDPYRAESTEVEIARRRPSDLTPRQRELLAIYGYPYVMEEFRFHLTLTGPMSDAEHAIVAPLATTHFAGVVPQPFLQGDVCLMGEDSMGRFHLLDRYALSR